MSTVADQFADTLAAAGVKRIYGVVGDSLNGLTDALRRQGKIEWAVQTVLADVDLLHYAVRIDTMYKTINAP
jgi:hypothetical protein